MQISLIYYCTGIGRYPLYITRYLHILRYWFRLLNTDNIILQRVYSHALRDCNNGIKNLVTNVKKTYCVDMVLLAYGIRMLTLMLMPLYLSLNNALYIVLYNVAIVIKKRMVFFSCIIIVNCLWL